MDVVATYRSNRAVRLLLGIALLFSGIALLMHIFSGVSLRVALLATVLTATVTIAVLWRRMDPPMRSNVRLRAKVGVIAGVLALVVYDAVKWLVSLADPSPYNPFEALWYFGVLLVGTGQSEFWIMVAGTGFHALNGIAFVIAYCFLLGRAGIVAGILWGLVLSAMQIAIYPFWLDVGLVQQFAVISIVGHVAYGATFGYVCKRGLERLETRPVGNRPLTERAGSERT